MFAHQVNTYHREDGAYNTKGYVDNITSAH